MTDSGPAGAAHPNPALPAGRDTAGPHPAPPEAAGGVAGPHPAPPGPGGAAPHPVPGPPPGPGVSPPFATPPVEGRTRRMWLGLGMAGLAVLLCCGGGAFALVGLAVAGSEALDEQARAVVGEYVGAIRGHDYDHAYQLLCDELQRRESLERFTRREEAEPEIITYRVGEPSISDQVIVPVRVTYSAGGQDTLRVFLDQDNRTGAFEVCGVE